MPASTALKFLTALLKCLTVLSENIDLFNLVDKITQKGFLAQLSKSVSVRIKPEKKGGIFAHLESATGTAVVAIAVETALYWCKKFLLLMC